MIFIAIISVLILFFITKVLFKKYIQRQIITKFRKTLDILREDEKKKIPVDEFISFLTNNININQDSFFKGRMKNFSDLYSDHYKKEGGISTLAIFICWITRIRYDILYIPNNNLSLNEYQNIYEAENENIFEKIEHQYKLNVRDGVNDDLFKNRLFYLRLNNTIELFLNKYIKESGSILVFYWFDFYPYFLKNISKINHDTWFIIESSLN